MGEDIDALLDALVSRAGGYGGHGINHLDQPFYGEVQLQAMTRGILLRYRATGIEGTTYHQEASVLARGEDGMLSLWCLNTNEPVCARHLWRPCPPVTGATFTAVFGRVASLEAFRMELALDLWPDGDIGYRHAWGEPGEAVLHRASVRMSANKVVPGTLGPTA